MKKTKIVLFNLLFIAVTIFILGMGKSALALPRSDVNADGISDLLIRDTATGQEILWFLNPDGSRSGQKILFTDIHCAIVGAGYFNEDNSADLLVRNDETGAVKLWLMNADGTATIKKTLFTDSYSLVVGVGDFDHDGIDDLIRRTNTTGEHVLWLMNADGTRKSAKLLFTDRNATIAGTGDFNGDGICDLIKKNLTTGQHVLWRMNADGTRQSYKTLFTDTLSSIVGIGDFNGDGVADLIKRKASTGQTILWLMNPDGTRNSAKLLFTDIHATVVETGDFNRDGISDFIKRNISTGQTVIWFMNPDGTRKSAKLLFTNLTRTTNPAPEIPQVITFVTEGSSFAPVIVVEGAPEIVWTWHDGTTSTSTTPVKDYGTSGKRLNTLSVTPWSAVQRINIGYDAGDGGTWEIEFVPDQHVSSVQGLELVAPYLAQWCSSYNEISFLNFSNFTNLDTIECFLSQTLRSVNLAHTPKLKRACFEDGNLNSLNLSGSPLLEDLRGAQNNYSTIHFGAIGTHVWHICVRDNPQITDQTLFSDMTPFPNISELFIWNDNQAGSLTIPATHPTNAVSILADGNQYTSLDLSGSLANSLSQATVSFRNNRLSNINIAGCSQITELDLENNLLDAAHLDTLLATLDALGRSSVNTNPDLPLLVNIQGNEDPGTDGYNAAVNLSNKGWTIFADSWTLYPPPAENNGEATIYFSTTGNTTQVRCDFTGTETTAIWHWSDGTTAPAERGENILKEGLGNGVHDHYLTITNGAALSRFGAIDGGGQGYLTSMTGFEKCTQLVILYAYNESNLTTLGRTATTRIKEYHLMGTALSAAAMDQIFADAVTTGVTNGTLWGPNSGTAAGESDRTTLTARGWTLSF